MEKSFDQDPDPHNNRCGSEKLVFLGGKLGLFLLC